MTEKIILDIQTKVGKAITDTKKLTNTTKGLNKEVNTTANLMKKAGSAMLAFASIGMITKALKDIIGLNIEFEKTLTNVLTLLDKTSRAKLGEFLSAGAINIMSTYGLKVADVNKALFDTISAGIKAGNSIRFLQEASVLAVGGVTTLSSAVKGMTSIMNAYGLAIGDANKVASAFFTAQKFGTTTVGELVENVGMVAPVARAAGIGFQEMLAAMALLTQKGLSTDMAATGLRATITALINTTTESEAAFKSMGIETGITAIRNNGLSKTLWQVGKAVENDADLLTQFIPNVRALNAVAALATEEGLTLFDEVLKTINIDIGDTSSLTEALNLQMETLAKKQEVLRGEWDALIISSRQGNAIGRMWGDTLTILSNAIDKLKTGSEKLALASDLLFKSNRVATWVMYTNELEKQFMATHGLLTEEQKLEEQRALAAIEWEKRQKALHEGDGKGDGKGKAGTPDVPDGIPSLLPDIDAMESYQQQFFTLLGDIQRESISNEEETNQELAKIKQKYGDEENEKDQAMADAAIQIEQWKQEGKLDIVKGASGVLQGLAGESFLLQKVLAIAESIVSTYLTAQLASQSVAMTPFVGPALAAAAYSTAVTRGWVNTALIAGTALAGFEEGGFTGKSKYRARDKDGRIAGYVHEDEFVFNREKTRTLRPLFEDIHNNRIDIHGLAALTRRGTMKMMPKLNADILERQVEKIYRKMSEEQTEKPIIIHHNNGYTKTIGNTTINVSN